MQYVIGIIFDCMLGVFCIFFFVFDIIMYKKMLVSAAADANRSLRQIEARQQSPDHPILWNVGETDYLKFFLFQVV